MNDLNNIHVVPVLIPLDTTSTATEAFTTPIDMGEVTAAEFELYFGVITGDDVVVKVYKDANTTTSGGTAVAFTYSLSAATGTDTKGAWTACASTGLTVGAGDDNKLVRISVDPALFSGYPYCYLGIDPGSSISALARSCVAVVVPRYQQDTPPSIVN